MYRPLLAFAAAVSAMLLGSLPAVAAEVSVTVTGLDGHPLAGAVVSLEVPGAGKAPIRGPYVMAQRDIAFDPHVLVVPVGATVQFPNKDQVRHHVYSFSRPKKFEIKLYGRDETKTEVFDTPGIVSLGCNIHDSMSGFIYVTTSPFTAMTDAAGRAVFREVPSGAAKLKVWDPSIRAPDNTLTRPVSVSSGGLQIPFPIR